MRSRREKYCELLNIRTRIIYNKIGSAYCPALGKTVVFNAKGYHHLHYKPDRTARDVKERIYKLRLLPLAVPVIKNADVIESVRNIKRGKQFALVAKVGRKNPVEVRVIILEVENSGHPIFWSIMKH